MATTPNKAEAMKAETPAAFARAIGADPKRLRSRLRSLGVKVSENRAGFNAKAKETLWGIFVENKTPEKTPKSKATTKKAAKASS